MVPCWRRRVHYTPAACDPPLARVRLPSPLVPGFVIGVLSDSKKREGNEEGDQLDLLHPSKETIPPKETSEVNDELHPVNWYRSACRYRLPFLCRSQHCQDWESLVLGKDLTKAFNNKVVLLLRHTPSHSDDYCFVRGILLDPFR